MLFKSSEVGIYMHIKHFAIAPFMAKYACIKIALAKVFLRLVQLGYVFCRAYIFGAHRQELFFAIVILPQSGVVYGEKSVGFMVVYIHGAGAVDEQAAKVAAAFF